MNNKELWLDVDGVLLNWCAAFLEFYNKKYNSAKTYEDLMHYNFSNLYPNEPEVFTADIIEFNKSEAYKTLAALANWEDLERLTGAGYDIHAITQISEDDTDVKWSRMLNLERNFSGLFSSVEFTFPGQCKLARLRELRPYGRIVVVEDNPSFLKKANAVIEEELHDTGLTSLFVFGIQQPYNRLMLEEAPFVISVPSMKEVTQILLRLEGKQYVA